MSTEGAPEIGASCDVCGRPGQVTIEPPRRTLARGADPDDAALSVIAVLPDVVLCDDHADQVGSGEMSLGWCDDKRCRIFGEVERVSPCGEPFKALKR